MDDICKKLKEYFADQGISQVEIAKRLNVTKAYINGIFSGRTKFGKDAASKWSAEFGFAQSWLLTGEGEMMKNSISEKDVMLIDCRLKNIPFYENIQVGAGQFDLNTIVSNEKPTSIIQVPNVSAFAALRVVGCSMEPEIKSGDIVLVDRIDQWERFDPDKIYLIVTRDDRMIKHIEMDDTDDNVIWCVSPNYRKFKIEKHEILYIYRVVFFGRNL